MGSGGTPIVYRTMSGQAGGRVMPGVHYGLTSAGTGGAMVIGSAITNIFQTTEYDYRVSKLYGYAETSGAPGGGVNNPGYDGGYTNEYYNFFPQPLAKAGTLVLACNSGSGGGWGAKGGDVYAADYATTFGNDSNGTPMYAQVLIAGGAGGKAVQTNGYAVTWLGGSNRAYGAVG